MCQILIFHEVTQAMDGGQSKADDGNGKQMKFDFGDDSSESQQFQTRKRSREKTGYA